MDYTNLCLGCMEEKAEEMKCPHCGYIEGSVPESALHLPPGTVLQEKYLIGKALGQGGFGITYLAWDFNLNLKLAIKEYLPQELAYRTGGQSDVSIYKQSLAANFNYGLEKFLEEARTLAQFNEHPNIVSVRDYFKANGTAYLVMNHMEGVTLKQYMESRKEPLPFEQALDIFMPVLDVLKEVHAAGILHRDISPDNLLLDAQGRVVLIDFGAARQAMGDKSRSMSVIMKAGYSPLEQYQSKGKQGPWTDIYAVAATMYHAVTGQLPPESMDRIDEDNLTPPSQLGINIGPYKEQALLKAMAVRAKDRYQTAEEFQEALLGKKPIGEEKSPEAVESTSDKQQDEGEESKKCPFCSEKIKATAIVCMYCKMSLQENLPKASKRPEKSLPGDEHDKVRSKEKGGSVKPEVKYSEDAEGQKSKAAASTSKTADKRPGIFKTAAILFVCGLLILGAVSLFGEAERRLKDDGPKAEEASQTFAPAFIATLDADYYIDYDNGNIPLSDLPIGARVVDPTWEWEFRTGHDYTLAAGDETKPVTWIVVAKNHYDGLEPHVTLLAEELIGRHAFDNSTNRGHEYSGYGYNHWGESGTHSSADRGLRPWLNSTGIHSGIGFYRAFSENLKGAVLTTTVPNKEWENGTSYNTEDHVFIPSNTELGYSTQGRITYSIGSVYPYFSGAGNAQRVVRLGGETRWYWTRSPVSYNGLLMCSVRGTGGFGIHGIRANDDDTGVRPALNLKVGTLVSEIGN